LYYKICIKSGKKYKGKKKKNGGKGKTNGKWRKNTDLFHVGQKVGKRW
jgi:hypothetical protein